MSLPDNQLEDDDTRECRTCGGWTTSRRGVCLSCRLDYVDLYADNMIQDEKEKAD